MKLNDLLALTEKQLAPLQENGLYLLRILFEIGNFLFLRIYNSYTRYPRKWFTQIYRALYADAMLELIRMSSNMADGNQQKHLLPSFDTKA